MTSQSSVVIKTVDVASKREPFPLFSFHKVYFSVWEMRAHAVKIVGDYISHVHYV